MSEKPTPSSMRAVDVTLELRAARAGDPDALARVFPLVLEELRAVARRQMRGRRNATLGTDGLVNEAYVKLVGGSLGFEDRAHFLGVAARAMRQVLIDYARKRSAGKRGGGRSRVTLASDHGGVWVDLDDLLALDQALDRLNELNPRLREVVEYRFFGGLSEDEIAHLLGVSTRTVERDWAKARMFLSDHLGSRSS